METGITCRGTGIMENNAAVKMHLTGREALPGGWEGLAAAVIYQACEDYRDCCRACRRYPDSRQAAAEKRQLEKFFRSRWFRTLSSLNGSCLLQQLKEETQCK